MIQLAYISISFKTYNPVIPDCLWVFCALQINIQSSEPQTVQKPSYGLKDRGSIPGTAELFTTSQLSVRLWDLPASYPVGTGTLCLGIRHLTCEPHYAPPSTVEVKNAWNCTSTSSYVRMAPVGVPWRKGDLSLKTTARLHLVPRLRTRPILPPRPPTLL
jgi:hypothetical protein